MVLLGCEHSASMSQAKLLPGCYHDAIRVLVGRMSQATLILGCEPGAIRISQATLLFGCSSTCR
eukprot:4105408-Pyramimonas_sp.AAC.1